MTPIVSVVIPNYNYAHYLDERINSILNQTFSDFEIILLDDASTDNSIEIIDKYKNNPLVSHCIVNKENSGYVFHQWEKGINLARGKYIWIAESDDLATLDFLEKTVGALERHPEANLCFCGSYLIDNTGGHNISQPDFDKRMLPDFDSACNAYLLESRFFINHYMVWTNTIYNASGALFRKDALNQDCFRSIESFRYCGDWLFWKNIINSSKVIILKDKLNRFRLHNRSATAKAFYGGETAIETFKVLLDILPEVNLPRQLICFGTVHRNCRRTFKKAVVKSFNQYYFKHLGIFKGICAIILERINKALLHIVPFTISQNKDIHIKPGTPYEV